MIKYVNLNDDTQKYELVDLNENFLTKTERKIILVNSSVEYNEEIKKLLTKYTRDNDIKKMCELVQLPYSFIEEYETHLRPYWDIILRTNILTEYILEKYMDQLKNHWFIILAYQKLSEQFLEKYIDIIDSNPHYWTTISVSQFLSDNFLLKYFDKIDWDRTISNHKLKDSTLIKVCRNYVIKNWQDLIANQDLSDEFVEEFADLIDWNFALKNKKLSQQSQQKFKFLIEARSPKLLPISRQYAFG